MDYLITFPTKLAPDDTTEKRESIKITGFAECRTDGQLVIINLENAIISAFGDGFWESIEEVK